MTTIRRLIPILLTLSLAAAACSLPGAQSTPLPTQPPVTITDTQAIAPTAEIIPSATPDRPISPPIAGIAQNVTLTSLKMFDSTHGWAAATSDVDQNPHILKTADGGITWSEATPLGMKNEAGYPGSLIAFTALDLNTVWAILTSNSPSPQPSSLIVWYTTDGGAGWTASDPLPVTDLSIEFFMPDYFGFSDPSHGWLLTHNGAGMNHDYVTIFTTSNAGRSWTRVVDPSMDNLWMSCSKSGLSFFDANRGWITYNCHGVKSGLDFYASSDGGHTWQPVSLPSPGISPDYFNSPANYCGIDGIVYSANPLLMISITCMPAGTGDPSRWLYTTPDNGSTWNWKAFPAGYGDGYFLSPTQGWFLGHIHQQDTDANTLYSTNDGGANWTSIKNVNWGGIPQFVDANNGWVLAHAGQEKAFVYTNNGGDSWIEIKPVIRP